MINITFTSVFLVQNSNNRNDKVNIRNNIPCSKLSMERLKNIIK